MAIRAIIGLGTERARVLAIRRYLVAGTMFDSKHTDRR